MHEPVNIKFKTNTFQRTQGDPECDACSLFYYIFATCSTDMYTAPKVMVRKYSNALVFGRCVVQISASPSTRLTDIFLFQTNSGLIPRLGHDLYVPNSFQFITHPTICRYIIRITGHIMTKPHGVHHCMPQEIATTVTVT